MGWRSVLFCSRVACCQALACSVGGAPGMYTDTPRAPRCDWAVGWLEHELADRHAEREINYEAPPCILARRHRPAAYSYYFGFRTADYILHTRGFGQPDHRRAVDAAIWGMPIVNFDAMRQAYFRDAEAKYNDIIWWPNRSGWKNQSLTVIYKCSLPVRLLKYTGGRADRCGLAASCCRGQFLRHYRRRLVPPARYIVFEGKGGKYLTPAPRL